MGISPDGPRKSNEEIEKEEMAREAADKARGFKSVDRRNPNVTGESSEKSVEERIHDADAAIEVSKKEDMKKLLENRLAEFDKKTLATASKVSENPDATSEEKKKAAEAVRRTDDEAEAVKKRADERIADVIERQSHWGANNEDADEEDPRGPQWHVSPATEEAMNVYAETQHTGEPGVSSEGSAEKSAPAESGKEQNKRNIELPKDEARLAGLRRKLADYKERIDQIAKKGEATTRHEWEFEIDSKLKFAILSRLLETGEVDFSSMSNEMKRDKNDFWFNNAWDVIKSYAETGGEDVYKGYRKSPLPVEEVSPVAAKEPAVGESSPEDSAGAKVSESIGEKKPWDQMNQKEREDAACQAALEALNNIAADQKPSFWERMKAGWSSLKESAKEKWDGAKAGILKKVFGENNEKLKNTWGFLKERLKGVATFGFWEFHQAEKFRAATRDIGKDVNTRARGIEEEEGLSKEEALKEAEKIRVAFEGINRDPSAQEYEVISRGISAEKIAYNQRTVENIIQEATKSLEDRLEKRSLLQGYRSADVGKKVLTPENIALLQERMRHQLNGMRNGQVRGDFKQYAQLMRRNLDPGWWKRYIYGGVEVALDGLALHLVTAPGAAEAVPAGTITKLPPPPPELVEPMHRTIWQTTAEFLKAHGIANPTNAQIMEGSKLVAQGNHIGVNVWNIPGNPLDTHMRAGYLLKLKRLVENLAHIQAM